MGPKVSAGPGSIPDDRPRAHSRKDADKRRTRGEESRCLDRGGGSGCRQSGTQLTTHLIDEPGSNLGAGTMALSQSLAPQLGSQVQWSVSATGKLLEPSRKRAVDYGARPRRQRASDSLAIGGHWLLLVWHVGGRAWCACATWPVSVQVRALLPRASTGPCKQGVEGSSPFASST